MTDTPSWNYVKTFESRDEPACLKGIRKQEELTMEILNTLKEEFCKRGPEILLFPWVGNGPYPEARGFGFYTSENAEKIKQQATQEHWHVHLGRSFDHGWVEYLHKGLENHLDEDREK